MLHSTVASEASFPVTPLYSYISKAKEKTSAQSLGLPGTVDTLHSRFY